MFQSGIYKMSIKRQDIIDRLKTALAITAGETYHRTITTVDEFRTKPLEASELSAVIVREVSDVTLSQGIESPHNRQYHHLTVELELVTNGLTMAQVRQHIADIYKAVGTDTTLGGYCVDVDPISDNIQVDQEELKVQGAIITIRILYQTALFQES